MHTLFAEKAFSAVNVTIPYKQTVIPLCSEVDDRALAIGAVNTVVNRSGRLCGYNTDFDGFFYLANSAWRVDPKEKHVIILEAAEPARRFQRLCGAAVRKALRL